MIPYWLLFIVWAAGALQYQRYPNRTGGSAGFWGAIIITGLFVGLRWHVGGDWGSYQNQFNYISLLSPSEAIRYTDPAYGLLSWSVAQLGMGVVTVNLICAMVFVLGLGSFCANQANPWLAVTIAVPYFVVVVAMGYTRQATAIGFVLFAIANAERRGFLFAVACVAIGALFHKTAVLTLPLFAASFFRRNFIFLVLGAALSVGIYWWVLAGAADRLLVNYVNSKYQSSGAFIRISMNLLAASVFLFFRKRLVFPPIERLYWFLAAVVSFVCVIGLLSFSSSVGVDRVALFLIPLQVAVYSQLPYGRSVSDQASSALILMLLVYSGVVMFIFFTLGNNAYYWLPYTLAPLATHIS